MARHLGHGDVRLHKSGVSESLESLVNPSQLTEVVRDYVSRALSNVGYVLIRTARVVHEGVDTTPRQGDYVKRKDEVAS